MTVAIKGMDMPKSCWECRMITQKINCFHCFLTDNYLSNPQGVIDKDCPLIALPEENKDMSWEELKEKVKKLIPKIEIWGKSNEYFDIKIGGLCFWQDGEILNDDDTISTNKTPYQMYQIIKALIGDDK